MADEQPYSNSIFWIEVGKIKPNPFQPRKEFDERALASLADSIRQYGVLQPLVVTRTEVERPDGGLATEYELIAGERRLRASRLAGLGQVPAVIRTGDQSSKLKLELAIIENLQREDLNPIDRAEAFQKLSLEFKYKHTEIAKKIGMSREYVANSIRILALPQYILDALRAKQITEGHTRPLLMLGDRPAEQETLFKDITLRRLSVREAERSARSVAVEKTRKKDQSDPDIKAAELELSSQLGTKVQIERKQVGGKIVIDFFSEDDLRAILEKLNAERAQIVGDDGVVNPSVVDDRAESEKAEDEANLYSVSNFSL